MTGKPKRQHWVPKFYLKYFATNGTRDSANPKVYVFDKKSEKPKPRLTSTTSICGQRYLYSPQDKDGNRDWAFEEYLGGMENEAAGYWDDLSKGQFDLVDPGNRRKLAEFLAALHLRNKLLFDLCKSIMENRNALFGGPKLAERPKHLEPHEEASDPTHPGRFFVQSTRNNIPRITQTFLSYHWMTLRCDQNILLTSDAPVTFINSLHRRSGPGSKNAKAIFPISPKSLLYMENDSGSSGVVNGEADSKLLGQMNPWIITWAERFVIADSDSAM